MGVLLLTRVTVICGLSTGSNDDSELCENQISELMPILNTERALLEGDRTSSVQYAEGSRATKEKRQAREDSEGTD